jgi:type III secretory pathway component EscT
MTAAGPASAYFLAFVRCSAFAATVPIVGSGAIPAIVRGAIALSLVMPVAQHVTRAAATNPVSIVACIESALVGASFGLAASVVASAAAAAGGLVDTLLASQAIGREPVFGGGSGPFGRLYALAFAMLFMNSGAMTHICERFATASASLAAPLTLHGITLLLTAASRSAIGLASPAIAAQLLGCAVASVAGRAAPRINSMMLTSPTTFAVVLLSLIAASSVTFAKLWSLARLGGAASLQ